MKKVAFAALAASLLASVSGANANTFNLVYTDSSGDYGLNLTLTADAIGGPEWWVTSMTGDVFGSAVPGGSESVTFIPGGPPQFTSPDGHFYLDNVLYPGLPGAQVLDIDGLGFTASGAEWNLWYDASQSQPYTLATCEGEAGCYTLDYGNVSLAPLVPEPSTWTLMGLGFAGLAFAGFHTRRSAISIA